MAPLMVGRHPQEQSGPNGLTLEPFVELAARGSGLARVRWTLVSVLCRVMPLPVLRRARDRDQSLLRGVRRLRAVFFAMTPEERDNPALVDHPRRAAIARAAGVEPIDVSQLRRNFEAARRAGAAVAAGRAAGRRGAH